METTIPIPAYSFKFDFKKVLYIIAILSFAFIITNYFVAQHSAEQIEAFTVEDAFGLAEEIYNNGEVAETLANLPLDALMVKKMTEEIERQLAKTIDYPGCEVYVLRARVSGKYPILSYGGVISGYIYLNAGEVWKVGMTKNGEEGRYNNGIFYTSTDGSIVLNKDFLTYETIYQGTFKKVITLEKLLIYTYPLWSGHIDQPNPPGCRIFR